MSARTLRAVERTLKDRPEAVAQLSMLIGELLLELRRAEQACHDLEERLDAITRRHSDLLRRVPIPCFLTDEHGVISSANREALLFLRASERHIIGKPAAFWFKDRSAAAELSRELRRRSGPLHVQLELVPRDRRAVTTEVVVQKVDGVSPPLWRWFLQRSEKPSSLESPDS